MVAVNTFQHNIPNSFSAHPPSAAQKVGTLRDLPHEQEECRWERGFGVYGKWGERGSGRNVRQEALVLPKNGLQNLLQSVDRNGNLTVLLSCKRRNRVRHAIWALFKEKK